MDCSACGDRGFVLHNGVPDTCVCVAVMRAGVINRRPCICGHAFDAHNDITRRCCFNVTVGLDLDGLPYPDPEEAPNPILRYCDLCPPSGFTERGEDMGLYGEGWPREHQLRGYGERENWRPIDGEKP